MADTPKENESLLTFPCDFTLKVFGLATEQFETEVRQLLQQHFPDLPPQAIKARGSENEKYRALSITVHVTSKEQLDNLYRALSSSPYVLMVL